MRLLARLTFFGLIIFPSAIFAKKNNDPTPSVDIGASVFIEKCSLCHGDSGMGEGIIPLKITPYPNTNLLKNIKANSREALHNTIVYGAQLPDISEYMPPMGNELTWTEVESSVDFILLLRADTIKAHKLLRSVQKKGSASIKEGLEVFEVRCALCHGKSGEGNGRMAKIIKNPPPFDLTASRVPDIYLKSIIGKGGESLGRSKQMPPWEGQLSPEQIESVILYIKTLRD